MPGTEVTYGPNGDWPDAYCGACGSFILRVADGPLEGLPPACTICFSN